jgi:hypothetical protein
MADRSWGFIFYGIVGMPILSPRSKFGTPVGLRGSESRGGGRRPKQNRSGSRGIGFGIRNRESMIQVCEFGIKAQLSESRKTSNGYSSDSQIDHFQFF